MSESLYLRYKDRLDRVLYSLIRVEFFRTSHHLFYAIEAGELEFGDAAAQFSIGPESKTQGIVGPVDLTTPHPEIAARLRTAKPRQLFPPFKADQWHVLFDLNIDLIANYDDKTRHFLGSLYYQLKHKDNQANKDELPQSTGTKHNEQRFSKSSVDLEALENAITADAEKPASTGSLIYSKDQSSGQILLLLSGSVRLN